MNGISVMTAYSYQTHSLRQSVSRLLRRPVRAEVWDQLVRRPGFGQMANGPTPERDLADEYSALEAVKTRRRKQPFTKAHPEVPADRRLQVLAEVMASEAVADPEVVAFRTEILGSTLIDLGHVASWIEAQRDEDGPPTTFLVVPVGDGTKLNGNLRGFWPQSPIEIDESNPAVGRRAEYIFHSVNRVEPVRYAGVLDRLRVISEVLAARFGWQEAEAVTFVLSGKAPTVPLAKVESSLSLPYGSRIRIDVDPTVPPQRLLKLYRNARAHALGGRHRAMSDKHLELARFLHFKPSDDRSSWRELMNEWNEANDPRWKYEDARNFRRDATSALSRLTGETRKEE